MMHMQGIESIVVNITPHVIYEMYSARIIVILLQLVYVLFYFYSRG